MSPHDPILVSSSGGFPIELIFLLLVLLGLVALSFGLASIFTQRDRTRSHLTKASPLNGESPFLCLQRGEDGTWLIQVNGHLYPNLDSVPEERTRKEVLAGLKALAVFSRAYLKKPMKAATATTPTKTPPAEEPPTKATKKETEPAVFSVTQTASVTPQEAMAALRALKERSRRKAQEMPASQSLMAPPQIMPTIDLAREIGEIVKSLQATTPDLLGRSIKLRNTSSGGVIFVVDGQVYHLVEEIPDAAIRALIKEATREWERRK